VCTRSARPSAHAPRPRASECCAQSAWSTYRVVLGYRNLAVARRGQRVRERGTQSHRPTVTQGIRERFRRADVRRMPVLCGVIANRIANPDERQATRPDDPTRGGRKPYPCAFFFLQDEIICFGHATHTRLHIDMTRVSLCGPAGPARLPSHGDRTRRRTSPFPFKAARPSSGRFERL
jgi:hypothetical protein